MFGIIEKMTRPRRLSRAAYPPKLHLRRLSPLLLLAAALFALAVLFAPGAQPAQAQSLPPFRFVTLSVSSETVVEGNPVTVTVTITDARGRSHTRSQDTVIPLVFPAQGVSGSGHDLGVTAEAGDYGAPTSITIPKNQRSATITITTAEDDDKDDEVFVVLIGDPPAPTGNPPMRAWERGSPDFGVIKILDDDYRWVSLSASPNPVTEGSSVTVTATLYMTDADGTVPGTTTPTESLGSAVTIPLTLIDRTAEADDHGTLSSITIPAGSNTGTGTITTVHDTDTASELFAAALDQDSDSWPSVLRAGKPSTIEIRIAENAGGL